MKKNYENVILVDENYRLIEQKRSKDLLKMFAKLIVIAFFLVVLIKANIGTRVIVSGESMYPTLNSGDLGICFKAPYKFTNKKFERGDIVTVQVDNKLSLIKRVVGLPGETVEIRAGEVFINGEKLDEPYINKEGYLVPTSEASGEVERFDLASYKEDYRKVMFMVDEVQTFELGEDEYLCLGDNRLDSLDSRNLGPFKSKNIQGKYFSK